ncbi:MAG: hypothetical protein AUJ98_11195 [Bacteroidetes bacterium CG2_30_33_31]|nr:MAG: hypothetical protein AUJ98_11195 [Bacteroidetes bacterium CG2_30_33_31]
MKNIANIFAIFLLFFSSNLISQGNIDFEISKNLDIYSTVIQQLNAHYVDDIHIGNLNKKAIEEMLRDLDPYTNYYAETQVEDVKYMRTGKYGGIGASIYSHKDTILVSSVLKDYPFYKSGIRAGDRIISVDGSSAIGKSIDELSDILKGSEGSSFNISILPNGSNALVTKDIVREEIKIKNVPYYGILKDGIAYIKLNQFTEKAAEEINAALKEMNGEETLKGLILDLRNNGGGLLQQAVEIMNIFLPAGNLIVATKGKVAEENFEYKTVKPAIFPDLPVLVLVNENSASASEIVAGAFQDIDRGVIMGQKSYGKGLVQKVFPLSYNAQMKITVAKYYIPSGRCIQAINYSEHDIYGKAIKISDSLSADFKTLGGRTVKDAGGILPDVILEGDKYSDIATQLLIQHTIFRFINDFVLHHDSIRNVDNVQISEDDFKDFKIFVLNSDFQYREKEKTELKNLLKLDIISSNKELELMAITLLDSINNSSMKSMEVHKEEIKKILKQELASRYFFDEGRIYSTLKSDTEIDEAVNLLKDNKRYSNILKSK